jgi:riboflavin synthase
VTGRPGARTVFQEKAMFTGIIESIGSIRAMTPKGGDVRLLVETGKLDLGDVKLGDSIAVSGVCLTVVELPGNGFAADVSRETLDCTAMNDLKAGSPVNLEKALTPTTRLGGHLVSGHVDGVGEVVARSETRGPWNSASVRRKNWPSTLPTKARSPSMAPA